MGAFEYMAIRADVTPADVGAELGRLAETLWGDAYRVERVPGIPIGPDDPRLAKWVFDEMAPQEEPVAPTNSIVWEDPAIQAMMEAATASTPSAMWPRPAFSVSLLRDGRLEFKVPRTEYGSDYARQRWVRKGLRRAFGRGRP